MFKIIFTLVFFVSFSFSQAQIKDTLTFSPLPFKKKSKIIEEFLVIVPLSDEDSVMYFANQLREKIQSHSFEQAGKVTVSLGATVYQNKELITQTISRADEALYLSKENGRNKATYL